MTATHSEGGVCPVSSAACRKIAAPDYLFEVLSGRPGAVNRHDITLTTTPM